MKKLCIVGTIIAFCAVSIVPSPALANDNNAAATGAVAALTVGLLFSVMMLTTISSGPRPRPIIKNSNEPVVVDKTIRNKEFLKDSKNNQN